MGVLTVVHLTKHGGSPILGGNIGTGFVTDTEGAGFFVGDVP